MDDLLSDSLTRLLEQISTPSVIRQIEAGGSAKDLWDSIETSGFLDTLVPEAQDGAGLGLTEAFPLLMAAGRFAVPAPLAQTMLARACLAQAGVPAPAGAIALLGQMPTTEPGAPLHAVVPFGRVAEWLLTTIDDQAYLLPLTQGTQFESVGHGCLSVAVRWSTGLNEMTEARAVPVAQDDIESLAAVSYAAQIAGAADRVLEMTLDYVNQRTQFGKPIGKFQAVQNQISIMAERVWVSRMAAQLACQSEDWRARPLLAAVGKARTSEAAAIVADISHAMHGAIGITEEYDLQLYTRKLREWRHAAGAETYWESRIGEALLRQNGTALSFMCETLSA